MIAGKCMRIQPLYRNHETLIMSPLVVYKVLMGDCIDQNE